MNSKPNGNSGDELRKLMCPKLPWMIDFHSKDDNVMNGQWKAAFASNRLEHLVNLNIDSDPCRCRLTKIMCTIGPSSWDLDKLIELMKAGSDIFRLKMTHLNAQETEEMVKNIRKARDKYSQQLGYMYNIAICFDLEGPGIYTGHLEDKSVTSIELQEGQHLRLTTDRMYEKFVNEDVIYISYQMLNKILKPGDKLYIDQGQITLEVLQIERKDIKCRITRGGLLSNVASVDIPGIPIFRNALSENDKVALDLACKLQIDIAMMSDLRCVENITEAREFLESKLGGPGLLLVPKIEFAVNVDEIDQLIEMADAIYLARERLRVEISSQKLFIALKMIMAKCNKAGKPVICASSLLESMITYRRPLKAELADVANSIFDGADCLVLSRETSVGNQPENAVKMIASISLESEAAIHSREMFNNLTNDYEYPIEPEKALVCAIVDASLRCYAAAIIVCTVSGKSAKMISMYRPRCPIIAITRYANVAQRLNLWRGVIPFLYFKKPDCNWKKDIKARLQVGMTYGKLKGFIRAGDAVIIVKAMRQGSGFTNSMQIVYASEFDALPPEKN